MIKKKLTNGVNLVYLPNDKFKTVYIRMNIYRPMGEEAAKNALLTRVLNLEVKITVLNRSLKNSLNHYTAQGLRQM